MTVFRVAITLAALLAFPFALGLALHGHAWWGSFVIGAAVLVLVYVSRAKAP